MDKKIKNTLVGIFIVGGFLLFIFLYIWLSGKLAFKATYDIKVYFDDVTGLRAGDPVLVYGMEKGKVRSARMENDRVLVTLAIERDTKFSDDTKISIRLVSYLGSDRYVKVVPGRSGVIPDVYSGHSESLELESIVARLDSLSSFIGNIKLPDLSNIGEKLSQSLSDNVKELAGMFKEPGDRIGKIVVKLDSLLDILSGKLQGDGTVGKMLESDELYNEILQTNQSLRALLDDIKANPKKYVNIKVF